MAHRTHPSRRGASDRSRTPGGASSASRRKRRDAARTSETAKTAEAPEAPDARNGASGARRHGTAPAEPPAPRLDDPIADVPLAGPPTRIDARDPEEADADLGDIDLAADEDEIDDTGGIASPAGDRVGNTKGNNNTEMDIDIDMDTDIDTDTDTSVAADADSRDGCEYAPFARDPGRGGVPGAGRAPAPQRAAPTDDAVRAYLRDPTPERAERLVRETRGIVYSTALRIVRDSSLAEDVVQDVYLRFFEEPRRAFGPGTASLVSDCVDLGRGVLRRERTRRARRLAAPRSRRGRGGVSLDDDEDEPRAGRLERSPGKPFGWSAGSSGGTPAGAWVDPTQEPSPEASYGSSHGTPGESSFDPAMDPSPEAIGALRTRGGTRGGARSGFGARRATRRCRE